MKYKINFEYDDNERSITFIGDGFTVTGYGKTYEALAQFAFNTIRLDLNIPGLLRSPTIQPQTTQFKDLLIDIHQKAYEYYHNLSERNLIKDTIDQYWYCAGMMEGCRRTIDRIEIEYKNLLEK